MMVGFWYLASPYSKYPAGLEVACQDVAAIAAALMDVDVNLFCPITHTHPIAFYSNRPATDSASWTRLQVPIMHAAVGMIVVQMDGWQESRGISEEREIFKAARKPILDVPPAVILDDPERVARICRVLAP